MRGRHHIQVCIHICAYANTCVYAYADTPAYIPTYIQLTYVYVTLQYIALHYITYIHADIPIHTYRHVCVPTHIRARLHWYLYLYIYIYKYIYTHTYMYIHVYMYTSMIYVDLHRPVQGSWAAEATKDRTAAARSRAEAERRCQTFSFCGRWRPFTKPPCKSNKNGNSFSHGNSKSSSHSENKNNSNNNDNENERKGHSKTNREVRRLPALFQAGAKHTGQFLGVNRDVLAFTCRQLWNGAQLWHL